MECVGEQGGINQVWGELGRNGLEIDGNGK